MVAYLFASKLNVVMFANDALKEPPGVSRRALGAAPAACDEPEC